MRYFKFNCCYEHFPQDTYTGTFPNKTLSVPASFKKTNIAQEKVTTLKPVELLAYVALKDTEVDTWWSELTPAEQSGCRIIDRVEMNVISDGYVQICSPKNDVKTDYQIIQDYLNLL